MVSVAFCPPHYSSIQASFAVALPHHDEVDAVPLLGFGMLPCLLMDDLFLKPSGTHKSHIGLQESQKLPYSII